MDRSLEFPLDAVDAEPYEAQERELGAARLALGENLILLVNLLWSGWLYLRFAGNRYPSGPLTGSGIGSRALSTDRQTLTVA